MAEVLTVRANRGEDDRKKFAQDFITLTNEGDNVLARALFDADPEKKDPGYLEYWRHYTPAFGYMPCPGDNCPECEDGDRPQLVADTIWAEETEEGSGEWKLKIFTINANLIRQFTALRKEGEKVKGRMFRVTRGDKKKGEYTLIPKSDTVAATQVKALLAEKDIDLEARANNTLSRQLERRGIDSVLEDKGDKQPTQARKGKVKEAEPEPDDTPADDDPDELVGETVTVMEIDAENNTATVDWNDNSLVLWFVLATGEEIPYGEGEIIVVSAEKDEAGDLVVSEHEGAGSDEGGAGGEITLTDKDELPDEIDGDTFVVLQVNDSDNGDTLVVENDDQNLTFHLFFLGDDQYDGQAVDWADYEEGMKVTVHAEKDNDGDMVAKVIPTKAGAKKATTAKKTSGRK